MNRDGDLPGRRSRSCNPTPMLRLVCAKCGRHIADVTDQADQTHPRWDSGGDLIVSWRAGVADARHLPDGQGYAALCRCGKPHRISYAELAATWRALDPRPGAPVRVPIGADR